MEVNIETLIVCKENRSVIRNKPLEEFKSRIQSKVVWEEMFKESNINFFSMQDNERNF